MKYRVKIIFLFFATIGQGYAQKLREKVGSNPTLIQSSVALEVESTSEGFLCPRMTQAQMNAISTPATGLMVYCTNCSPACFQVFNGSAWTGLCSGGGGGMIANCEGNGFKGNYFNNIPTSGATFSTTITNNSFATATINFAASDLVLSGLAGLSVGTPTPSTATLNSGQSQLISYPILGTPVSTGPLVGTWTKLSLNCSSTKEVKPTPPCYAPTSSGGYLVFQCHNLGANESANPFTPSWELNGAYIQWGKRGPTPSWQGAANDGASGFAAAPTGNTLATSNNGVVSGWINQAADTGSWNSGTEISPVKTNNDPCPEGYRVPTKNEWISICSSTPVNTQANWSAVQGASWINGTQDPTNYSAGMMVGSNLYLPATGKRDISDGALIGRSEFGLYWSSTPINSDFSYNLFLRDSIVDPATNGQKLYGFSVRCVVD